MGGYEIIVKTEEIKKKLQEGDYSSAQRILDTIELKKVKNIADLSLMAEVYTQNGRYDEALELLLRVYHKTKTRKVLYQLVSNSILRINIEEAEGYLKEYEKLAPRDFYKYVFRYQIDKAKGEGIEVLIDTLQTLKETEYIEQWAYELAKLYYKAGMEEECIRECSDIILWFGEGSYVEKAKVLRAYYSGEADKDKIIEELKKRANPDTARIEKDTYYEKEQTADSEPEKTDEDFRVEYPEDEGDDFTDHMKRDVEEILLEEGEETEDQEYAEDEIVDYKYTGEEQEQEESDVDTEKKYPEEDTYAAALSERELEEQEVEDELYRLLEEEDEEDNADLNHFLEETGIDLYEVFGNFLYVKSVRKQLLKSIEMILDKHTKSVQMIITGLPGSGKTALAKEIAVFLNKTGKLKSSRIAKISAENLNTADISAKRESLRDCCLVIEDASELKRPTIEKLLELIKLFHGDIAVIFEENKKNMNKLFRECPKLMDMFKNRIHLPQYTEEELLGFAYSYIRQKDYRLQRGASTALKNAVGRIVRKEDPNLQLELIQKLVQDAMNSADVRTGKQLPNLAATGRIRDVEILSILPEDFHL